MEAVAKMYVLCAYSVCQVGWTVQAGRIGWMKVWKQGCGAGAVPPALLSHPVGDAS